MKAVIRDKRTVEASRMLAEVARLLAKLAENRKRRPGAYLNADTITLDSLTGYAGRVHDIAAALRLGDMPPVTDSDVKKIIDTVAIGPAWPNYREDVYCCYWCKAEAITYDATDDMKHEETCPVMLARAIAG